jgi:hypothetical protein
MSRYLMPEADVDVPLELRLQTDCAICGLHDEFGTITLRLAWYRDKPAPDAVARCLDVRACRARVAEAAKPWPLLERGETPHNPGWTPEADRPMESHETTQPDEVSDDWI